MGHNEQFHGSRGQTTARAGEDARSIALGFQMGAPDGKRFPGASVNIARSSVSTGRPEASEGFTNAAALGTGRFTKQMRTKTVTELVGELMEMDTDTLIQLQVKLAEAGLFGDTKPIWGVPTSETRDAFRLLLQEALSMPNKTYTEVLSELRQGSIDQFLSSSEFDTETVTLSDRDTILESARSHALEELGMELTPELEEIIVGSVHANEKKQAAARAQLGGDGKVAENDLRVFMRALSGPESGGDPTARNARTGAYGTYQIMPENWPRWAPLAGLPANAPQTPANQERVAAAVMKMYYKQFGNWRDVAVAWYAGPGRVNELRHRDMTVQGGKEPSVHQYADKVMSRFEALRTTPGVEQGYAVIEDYDPDASMRAQIREMDPAGAGARDFADTMGEFFSLLGGAE